MSAQLVPWDQACRCTDLEEPPLQCRMHMKIYDSEVPSLRAAVILSWEFMTHSHKALAEVITCPRQV